MNLSDAYLVILQCFSIKDHFYLYKLVNFQNNRELNRILNNQDISHLLYRMDGSIKALSFSHNSSMPQWGNNRCVNSWYVIRIRRHRPRALTRSYLRRTWKKMLRIRNCYTQVRLWGISALRVRHLYRSAIAKNDELDLFVCQNETLSRDSIYKRCGCCWWGRDYWWMWLIYIR